MIKVKRVKGKDAKVFGVLAGISRALDPSWDPIIIRLIFLALIPLSGGLILPALYFILAAILKSEVPEKSMYHAIKRTRGKEAKLCGVLGGISKHLDPEKDPFLMRMLFLVLALFSGFVFMFALYFILAIVLHKEDKPIEEVVEEDI